jgi:anti-repressor protein
MPMQPPRSAAGAPVPVGQGAAVHRFPETGQDVRTILIDGEPWFVAMDVCRVLDIGRTHDAVRGLDPDERGTDTIRTPGGDQQVSIVSEAGLYALIMRSRKKEARAFRRWITHEVLPSIRRTGAYSAPQRAVPALDTPEGILAMATAFRAAAEDLVGARQRVAELEPAAEAWQVLGEGTGNFSLRETAAILNQDPAIKTGQNRLAAFLRDEGLLDAKGRPYVRYARYILQRPMPWTHPHTGEPQLGTQLRITPAGVAFLHQRLGGIKAVAL